VSLAEQAGRETTDGIVRGSLLDGPIYAKVNEIERKYDKNGAPEQDRKERIIGLLDFPGRLAIG